MNTKDEHKILVFVDGECVLCRRSVKWLMKHDPQMHFKFYSLQSEMYLNSDSPFPKNDPDAVVIFSNDVWLSGSDAAVEIFRFLNQPMKMLSGIKFLPKFMREGVYKLIGQNRYRIFGRDNSYCEWNGK